MSTQINLEKLTDAAHWIRIVLMLVFFVVLRFAQLAIAFITVLQVLANILTAKPYPDLTQLAKSLTLYVYQINQFNTYQKETRPFPFSPWPHHSD